MIPIDGHKNLFRDEDTGAIINYDTFEYEQYVRIKNERKNQKDEIKSLRGELETIKSMLKELIDETRRN